MEWRIKKTTGTNGVLHIAFTAEEYNSLNGDYTGLQANMRRPFREYMIYNTSPFDALTTLTYLFKAQDLPTQCPRHLHGLAWDYNAMVSLSHLQQQPTWTRLSIMVHTTAIFGGAHEWHSGTAGYNICLKQQLFYTCFLTPRPTKLHSFAHIFCAVAFQVNVDNIILRRRVKYYMPSLAVQLGHPKALSPCTDLP